MRQEALGIILMSGYHMCYAHGTYERAKWAYKEFQDFLRSTATFTDFRFYRHDFKIWHPESNGQIVFAPTSRASDGSLNGYQFDVVHCDEVNSVDPHVWMMLKIRERR